jgi:GTP-binding protein EngB required for normal cell division
MNNMHKKLLELLLNKSQLHLLNSILTIEQKINEVKKKMEYEENRYKIEVAKYMNKIKKIQETCNHFVSTHYSDLAGGNSSYTKCHICGKEY